MAALKITGFELYPLNIPLKKPFITALRRVEHIDDLLLVIHTDTELRGYGGACAVTAITGTTNADIIQELDTKVFPTLIRQPLQSSHLFDLLERLSLRPETRACIDIGIHDLLAKIADQPLYAYLGGKNNLLSTDLTISVASSEKMVQESLEAVAAGFKQLKIKLDADLSLNIQRLRQILRVLPGTIPLRLDPNQSLTFKQAVTLLESIPLDSIECIEQPFKADDIESLRSLRELSLVPVLADESLYDLNDALNLFKQGACDMFNIKLMKCGGIHEAQKIAAFAGEQRIACMMGSMLEGPVSLLAAAHFSLSQPAITMIDMDSPLYLEAHPLLTPFYRDADTFHLAKNPGLGIDEFLTAWNSPPVLSYFQTPPASSSQTPAC